jgi:hypothetical protein
VRSVHLEDGLLSRRADAVLHVAEQTRRHFVAEFNDDVDEIIGTLAETGPYAYTHPATVDPDGGINQIVETTIEGIRAVYHELHGFTTVLPMDSFTEIRGDWYTFHEGIGNGTLKSTNEHLESDTLVIFPVGDGQGIKGELFWWRPITGTDDAAPGFGAPVSVSRKELLDAHDALLDAYRLADAAAIEAAMDEQVRTSIRDYVDDTGTLVQLRGTTELRSHYERFFAKFEVISVDIIYRLVQDWYLFSELRYKVRVRTGSDAGSVVTFNTAEFTVFAPDGRGLVRTGHGTDLEEETS